jgi:hypothetical protein
VTLPVGLLLDRVGPKWTFLLGGILQIGGCVVVAFQLQYLAGFMIIAVGGQFILLASFHIGYIYPGR